MKQLAAAVAASLLLPLAQGADGRPGVDAFFSAMAIEVAPGQQKQFVVGDNVAGYFEAYTQSYTKGQGYQIRDSVVFKTYASSVNGQRLDRTHSTERVLPYGHQVSYADGASEEMALLSGRNALAIRLTSAAPAALAIQASLPGSGPLSLMDEMIVAAPLAPNALYVAIAGDRPLTMADATHIGSREPASSMTLVLAFGASAAEAALQARTLAATDPISAERRMLHAALTKSYLATSDAEYNKALNWAKAASRMFVVEQFGTGIWAGLPWFRDNWGRDSFIALPGTLLVSGQFDQAKAVLANFARYQNLRQPREREYGRVPNRVSSGDIIYNTVDGTPWMLREALEYIRYSGDKAFAAQAYQLALPYFEGAIANYMDRDQLLTHDSADTWMDARIEGKAPWSARGPRAVEIQALWYNALQTGAALAREAGDTARADQWSAIARKAKASFTRLFWDGRVMADRLRDDASRDTKVRPNQLMVVTIPGDDFVAPDVQAKVVRNAVSQLLYPYGIASLSQDDPYFHPRHENPAFHHKDAAYHQGTIWGWNAGFTVSALGKFGYQDLAWSLSQNLGGQILGLGTLGNMSELLDALPDANGHPKPSGTYAQSWSVAEFARNAYQDYVGFRPDLVRNSLAFQPAVPNAWTSFYAVLPFGAGEQLDVDFSRAGKHQRWQLHLSGTSARRVSFAYLNADKSRSETSFTITPGQRVVLELGGTRPALNGKVLATRKVLASYAATIGTLRFRQPAVYREQDFPVLSGRDVLKSIIDRNDYR